jgi:ferredoxin
MTRLEQDAAGVRALFDLLDHPRDCREGSCATCAREAEEMKEDDCGN